MNYTKLDRLDLELNYLEKFIWGEWLSFWIGALDFAIIWVAVKNAWGYIRW